MSFNFTWPTFSAEFYSNAIHTLTTALNRGQKPKAIVGDIVVQELHMGTVPPELEILEIGDLSRDRFRGIFRFVYAGDAHLELSTGVQANPLARSSESLGLLAGPAASRGMLFAASPLTVPMRVRLSDVKLRAIVVLVVSRTKGITLVFKNDPLESVRVSSTFDSVGVIQKYLQEEIEGQLREMFREDLPGIIHRLSQDWLRTETAERASPAPPPRPTTDAPPPPDRPATPPLVREPWSMDDSAETPLSVLALENAAPQSGAPGLTRLASTHGSSRGLKDLVEPRTQSPTRARTFHTTSRVRAPMSLSTSTPPPPAPPAPSRGLDVSSHLAELLRANHTLSPYTPNPRLVALRTTPPTSRQRSGRAVARQTRVFHAHYLQ
ncbi:Similar to S.cerevisiae protein MDM34 (Mitochondrial component of the ERMES complex) [Malassezia sympodialis ATCC 42132]|uniref:Mitochondrial distribution and morphology protein 34 n=1 Tax=Malassezia sympodialis (strain ATCC 42132) TaxID=1230383 RepID=A0A1M8A9X2_MALS4|nr:Similar to S.cerevisiae protein MDM34 (Mitochondrial component of the ERMES complex) [Malassezia sympodialis ATCC 42132]